MKQKTKNKKTKKLIILLTEYINEKLQYINIFNFNY